MGRDIILFYFYSTPPLPEGCILELRRDIAYRNMFLLPSGDSKIHFEFPMFEEHTYNTICNRKGLRGLIKKRQPSEKYIVFRTKNLETGDCNIIGYYRVKREYYQETRMFNNNGFVWGIEAYPYLIKKGLITCNGLGLRQGYKTSWGKSVEWKDRLNEFIDKIEQEENISEEYKSETNRLVDLFKDMKRVPEMRQACKACLLKNGCTLHRRYRNYKNLHPESDMFSVLHNVYNSNLYSKNVLDQLPKVYLKNNWGG